MVDVSSGTLFARPGQRHRFTVRRAQVVSVLQLTPTLRRIRVTGQELSDFQANGPADHVRLFVPRLSDRTLIAPIRTADGIADPPEGRPVGRDYTPRVVRRSERGVIVEFDIVLHDRSGPISSWAADARVGDAVALVGPRGSRGVPFGIDRLVAVVDETGLPAAAGWAAALAPETRLITVALQVDRAIASRTPYQFLAGPHVHWVDRPDDLVTVVSAQIELGPRGFLFAAAEAGALVPLRRYLRSTAAVNDEQLDMHGYWRGGVAGLDHHAPIDPDEQKHNG